MGLIAVAAFAVGAVLVGGIDGNTVAGFGQVLIGLAAVIAALAGLRNGQRIKAADAKAEVAAVSASDAAAYSATAVRTLGPENGKTLRAVLDQQSSVLSEIKGFEEYQHQRNHDILAGLTRIDMSMPVLVHVLEKLLARLDADDLLPEPDSDPE